jgi:hypothetical protein
MPMLMERLPTIAWNDCPRSRGTDAHDRWNAHYNVIESFDHIGRVVDVPMTIVVGSDLPVK